MLYKHNDWRNGYFSAEMDKTYVFSMMANVDELNSKRHMEMNILCFYEGLSRVVDILPLDSMLEGEEVLVYAKMEDAIFNLKYLVNRYGREKGLSSKTMPKSPFIRKLNTKSRIMKYSSTKFS